MTCVGPSVSGEGLFRISAEILQQMILLLEEISVHSVRAVFLADKRTFSGLARCRQLYQNFNNYQLIIIAIITNCGEFNYCRSFGTLHDEKSQPWVHLTIWGIFQSLFAGLLFKLWRLTSLQPIRLHCCFTWCKWQYFLPNDRPEQNAVEQIHQRTSFTSHCSTGFCPTALHTSPTRFIIPLQTYKQTMHPLDWPFKDCREKPIKCLKADSATSEPSAVTSLLAPPISLFCSVNTA